MTKVFLLAALALVSMGFVACSEESRLGIKKPLVFPTMDNYGKIYYAIQSQDENTAIEDIIVNRGNCGSGLNLPQYKYDYDLVEPHTKELCAKYKDKGICGLYFNNEQRVYNVLDRQGKKMNRKSKIYLDKKEDVDYFNNLHDDFKKLYSKVEPRKLGYGETMKIDIGECNSSNIMEVQLILNGGKKVTYNLKGGY